jgi:hypothetical protein
MKPVWDLFIWIYYIKLGPISVLKIWSNVSLVFIIYMPKFCFEIKKKSNFLCRIWGFHIGGYEEYYLLGYGAV